MSYLRPLGAERKGRPGGGLWLEQSQAPPSLLSHVEMLHKLGNMQFVDNESCVLYTKHSLPELCNMTILDNNLLAAATRLVQERLPPGWEVERVGVSSRAPRLRITSKEGRSGEVTVVALKRPDPRSVKLLPPARSLLVTAPYLSRSVRHVLEEAGASYLDQTGNVRLVLDEPGLFISTTGAAANPWPDKRRFTLRGVKAGRVVCALVRSAPPIGVRELGAAAGTDPGYVSRLLGMLDREALVDRTSRGRVARVDWRKVLERWAEEAPLESRCSASTWLAPRGLPSLWDSLRSADFRYRVTGSAAAARIAPVAPTRLASVYVEDAEHIAGVLELRATEAAANIILLEPVDAQHFEKGDVRDRLRCAPLPLVVADLLSGPGRSPAEAEAVMDWMADHLEVWRG
ncbi:MAG: hypothetical protein DRI90_08615 [Deltaproteobacteria bacterium]|nr:MAG: hypothetical protein DRI90_08615 [Deltaproteobacteria bacterium]